MTYTPVITSNVSVGNSTTTLLTTGQSFSGAVEDVSLYASVSVSYYVLPTSATGNIFVQFSATSSPFYPISNTVTPVTSLTSNGFTLDTTMTAQYIKVSYINDSVNQTTFAIQTIYHPQARIAVKSDRLAVPMNNFSDLLNTRSIVAAQTQGSNPTVEVLGSNGNQSLNVCINDPRSSFNEVCVAQLYPLAQMDFVYGINTLITSSNVVSNASVTATNGFLKVTSNGYTSGSGSQSAAIMYAKKFVKYRAGQGAQCRLTSLFSQPATQTECICVSGVGFAVANTTYPIDFVGFGYGNPADTTKFGILWRNNKFDTWYPQSTWNFDTLLGGTKSGYTLAPQSLNSWQIQFQYCGNILFSVENANTGRYILVHSIPSTLVAPTTPNFQNPTLQLMWYSNSSATSSNTLSVYGASGGHFLEGNREFTGSRGAISSAPIKELTLNQETMILAVKNATYYGSNATNVIPCRSQIHLRGATFSSCGQASTPGKGSNNDIYFSPAPATVTFRQVRNPTSGGPTLWTPYGGINQSDTDGSNIYGTSTVSSNTAQLTGITGGATGFTVTVPCGGTQFIDFEQFESVAYPGDILCFTANVVSSFSTSNVNVGISLTWNEDT